MFASFFTAIGSLFTTLSAKVAAILPKIMPFIGSVLNQVVKFLQPLAESMMVKPEGMKMEEYGDRRAQMDKDGITRDDFESDEEFLSAVKSYELDPELSAETDLDTKIALGSSYCIVGLSEKLEQDVLPIVNLALNNPDLYNSEKFAKYVELSTNLGVSLHDIAKFYTGDLSLSKADQVEGIIGKVEKSVDPSLTKEDIDKFINKQM